MNPKFLKVLCAVALIVWLLVITKLIVFKYPDEMMHDILSAWSLAGFQRHLASANLIPFSTINRSLFDPQLRVEVTALIYNVVALIPLGFLLPGLGPRFRISGTVLIAGLLVSLGLEGIQLVTMLGSFDIDDVILNVTGALVGYGVSLLVAAGYRRWFGAGGRGTRWCALR